MFTEEELKFIHLVLAQLTWKTGQSHQAKLAEDICKKIEEDGKDA